MSGSTPRTLAALAAGLLLVGAMVGAPEAGVLAAGLAGLAALGPLLAAGRGWRVAGVGLLVLSLALGAALWPAAAARQGERRARAAGR